MVVGMPTIVFQSAERGEYVEGNNPFLECHFINGHFHSHAIDFKLLTWASFVIRNFSHKGITMKLALEKANNVHLTVFVSW